MEAVSTPNSYASQKAPTRIFASELLSTFERYRPHLQVLSLDCFDTLLWRKTFAPKDVFFDLERHPTFIAKRVTAINRIDAEALARQRRYVKSGHGEVTLAEIYQEGFPSLTATERQALIDAELSQEIATCYGFPPVQQLMRLALQQGVRIIIVSNTYLREPELRKLLQHTLPPDIFAGIHKIFCSCEYQQSKSGRLFDHVLNELGNAPNQILHIGDNYAADLNAPLQRGINALHLVQFNEKTNEFLRLQATAATLTDTTVHSNRSMMSPFRGLYAQAIPTTQTPQSLIGYLSVGPIMYTFARYLNEEIDQIKKSGKSLKVLFLMRDAYLPSLACEAFAGEPVGTRVRISRYSAIAASFRTKEEIENYVASMIESNLFDDICKQLLFTTDMQHSILQYIHKTTDPRFHFVQYVMQPAVLNHIINSSKAYWDRLKKYLIKEANIQSGDTVMMVDLGYAGRSQSAITPIFKSELGVDTIGRYLITLNTLEWHHNKRGLIDPACCDDRTMQALCFGSTLFEELCCSSDNSVIDYDQEGNPIYALCSATPTQREKTKFIQAEVLRFIQDAKQYFADVLNQPSLVDLRDAVLSELARRTFLPLQEEIGYLQEYQHDVNRGSDLAGITFDTPEQELKSLRRQGLLFKNQNPYGLRSAALPLTLALFTQYRHGFAVNLDDMSLREEKVTVMLFKNQQIEKRLMKADSTYDGYFSLWFVVDANTSQAAILFGLHYEALQIECVELISAPHFLSVTQYKYLNDVTSHIVLNQITKKAEGFCETESDQSAMIIPINIPPAFPNGKAVLRIVFRPIIRRNSNSV